jgi:membrane dipeptidase
MTGPSGSPSPVADCHNDLLMGVVHQQERGHADPFGAFWLPLLREGGVVLQVLPICTEEQFVGEGALRRALRFVEAAWRIVDAHADDVALVTTGQELDAALATDRIALVLAFEGMEPVGHDIELVDTFWRLGVRMASLTWNRRTMLADGVGEAATGGRLTSLGVAAVERMEALGMIVDVSHLSDAGFEHVARIASRPFVASHSSCRALTPHPRNLTDEMLRAIARSGGFACLNAVGAFVGNGRPSVDDFLAHAAHAVEVVGPEHVGLGLDFVADLFEQLDPILGGALVGVDQLRLIEGLRRPTDLPALGPRLVARLGPESAARVSSRTLVEGFRRLLPSEA